MTSSCPHCGQALDGQIAGGRHASTDISTTVLPVVPGAGGGGGADISVDSEAWVAPSRPTRRSIPPRAAAGAVAAVVAIVAAIVVFGSGTGSGGGDEDLAEGVPVPSVEIDEAAPALESQVGDAAGVGTADPLATGRLVSDSVAELFRDQIGDWAVVYPSPMGLQVLSEAGTVQPAIETATGFEEAAQFPLISDGRRSWAVDPGRLEQVYLVSTQFVVIDIDQDGRVAFINDARDPRNIGESSYGAWGPGFDVPVDAEILAVRERGLFVLPRTGGTFEYVPNGVEAFSDDVLVAASTDSEVFERCDAELVCELYLTTPSRSEPRVLEFDSRDSIWVSPGGEWLVVRTLAGESMLVSTETAVRVNLAGSVRAVDWSDDASIAAVLTDEELTMVFPERPATQSVTLPIAPSAPAVLLVPTSPPAAG